MILPLSRKNEKYLIKAKPCNNPTNPQQLNYVISPVYVVVGASSSSLFLFFLLVAFASRIIHAPRIYIGATVLLHLRHLFLRK